jgi:hypothetical protein
VGEGIVIMSLTMMADVLWLQHGLDVSYNDVSINVCDLYKSQTRVEGDSFFKGD